MNNINNTFISEEVKSKIELDLKEKTNFNWEIPMFLEIGKEWFQFDFKKIENPDFNIFNPFIKNANFVMSVWSYPEEKGYAFQYNVSYNLKSAGSNGMTQTYYYDKNGNFVKEYNY